MSELRTNKIVPKNGLPSGATGGGILQVVTVNKTDAGTLAGSYTQNTEILISGLSLSITPSSASNKIWLQGFVSHNVDSSQQLSFFIARNGTNITPIGDAGSGSQKRVFVSAQGNQDYYSSWVIKNTPFWYMDSPATTSAITYQVGGIAGVTGSTQIYINRGERDNSGTGYDYRAVSNLTAWEISA